MQKLAVGFGVLLIIVGVVFYFGATTADGLRPPTALIPSVIGLVLAVCGLLARQELRRKATMHVAAGVALLGFLACLRGVGQTAQMLSGAVVKRPDAAIEQMITALICLVFVVLCAKSFAAARRAKI